MGGRHRRNAQPGLISRLGGRFARRDKLAIPDDARAGVTVKGETSLLENPSNHPEVGLPDPGVFQQCTKEVALQIIRLVPLRIRRLKDREHERPRVLS
jgi:hypothetical protein